MSQRAANSSPQLFAFPLIRQPVWLSFFLRLPFLPASGLNWFLLQRPSAFCLSFCYALLGWCFSQCLSDLSKKFDTCGKFVEVIYFALISASTSLAFVFFFLKQIQKQTSADGRKLRQSIKLLLHSSRDF